MVVICSVVTATNCADDKVRTFAVLSTGRNIATNWAVLSTLTLTVLKPSACAVVMAATWSVIKLLTCAVLKASKLALVNTTKSSVCTATT